MSFFSTPRELAETELAAFLMIIEKGLMLESLVGVLQIRILCEGVVEVEVGENRQEQESFD